MRRQILSSGAHISVFIPSLAGLRHANWATVVPDEASVIRRLVLSGLFWLNFSHVTTKLSAGEYYKVSILHWEIKSVSCLLSMLTRWMPSSSTIAACLPASGAKRANLALS